jgi:hypothetical protein
LNRLFLSLLSGNDGNPNGHFETFFKNFDNETGADSFIVPNIIHFIRFDKFPLGFVDYVVLKAAMRNHKPDKFFFHTDVKNATCDGKYWDLVKKDRDLWSRIEVKYLEAPTEIFGQQLSEDFRLYHGSDIARIRVLMQYGGIYLDNDCFVIHSLDKYRKFECVVNWDEDQFLGNQVFIAHKNSRFLALYLESYKDNYYPDRWSIHFLLNLLFPFNQILVMLFQVLQWRGKADNRNPFSPSAFDPSSERRFWSRHGSWIQSLH